MFKSYCRHLRFPVEGLFRQRHHWKARPRKYRYVAIGIPSLSHPEVKMPGGKLPAGSCIRCQNLASGKWVKHNWMMNAQTILQYSRYGATKLVYSVFSTDCGICNCRRLMIPVPVPLETFCLGFVSDHSKSEIHWLLHLEISWFNFLHSNIIYLNIDDVWCRVLVPVV